MPSVAGEMNMSSNKKAFHCWSPLWLGWWVIINYSSKKRSFYCWCPVWQERWICPAVGGLSTTEPLVAEIVGNNKLFQQKEEFLLLMLSVVGKTNISSGKRAFYCWNSLCLGWWIIIIYSSKKRGFCWWNPLLLNFEPFFFVAIVG